MRTWARGRRSMCGIRSTRRTGGAKISRRTGTGSNRRSDWQKSARACDRWRQGVLGAGLGLGGEVHPRALQRTREPSRDGSPPPGLRRTRAARRGGPERRNRRPGGSLRRGGRTASDCFMMKSLFIEAASDCGAAVETLRTSQLGAVERDSRTAPASPAAWNGGPGHRRCGELAVSPAPSSLPIRIPLPSRSPSPTMIWPTSSGRTRRRRAVHPVASRLPATSRIESRIVSVSRPRERHPAEQAVVSGSIAVELRRCGRTLWRKAVEFGIRRCRCLDAPAVPDELVRASQSSKLRVRGLRSAEDLPKSPGARHDSAAEVVHPDPVDAGPGRPAGACRW